MKAVRLVQIGRPLEGHDIPVPTIGDRDVLIRVRAAGICHSDVHYRAGRSPMGPLPLTLGHEVAGVVEQIGPHVQTVQVGDRVCVHYLLSCGECFYCSTGHEQFCERGAMLGHHAPGGYAEYIAVPDRNAVPLPASIPFEQGAILMCSAATVFHALRKARLQGGETVAIFGVGGLGISALQLARAFGALDVYAVDLDADKLRLAAKYGAIPVDATAGDPVAAIRELTGGRGVDVALEVIGLPVTMQQAVQVLAVLGRAVIAGVSSQPLSLDTYRDLLGREAELIGSNDHLLTELPALLDLAQRGRLDLTAAVTRTIPLDAGAINAALDELESYGAAIRTVIVP
jgi:2-desacetyl-2-hydroxyethyl bacteriochlorophyllide A dehydrogenase